MRPAAHAPMAWAVTARMPAWITVTRGIAKIASDNKKPMPIAVIKFWTRFGVSTGPDNSNFG